MTDILIRATKEKIAHKMNTRSIAYAWWTLMGKPSREPDKVLFTDGKRIIAEGEAMGWSNEKKAIVFKPLKKVDRPLPKKAPTRGFTYVD